jgi:hypothetical protein
MRSLQIAVGNSFDDATFVSRVKRQDRAELISVRQSVCEMMFDERRR